MIENIQQLGSRHTDKLSLALPRSHINTTKEERISTIPEQMRDLIRKKNKARQISQRTRDPIDRERSNRLKNKVSEALQKHYNADWDRKMNGLEKD